MNKKIILGILLSILVISTATATLIPNNEKARENAKAPENSPVIDETESGEWALDRVDFIHYLRPDGTVGKATTNCYKLLGVKWTTLPVNYRINPANPQNLNESFVTTTIQTSAETWDSATANELFDDNYIIDYSAQFGIQNYQNAIVFGDYPQSNVIAVTSIWFTRAGKRLVEFDMMFDTDFAWGDATINSTKMDLQNIATHELGHAVGLADIYTSLCGDVTMYGYSAYGETKKRTLEAADIAGLLRIYKI